MSRTLVKENDRWLRLTSTIDQMTGFEAQLRELAASGAKRSSRSRSPQLPKEESFTRRWSNVRENDIFVVAKLDRLARSVPNLITILQTLERNRARVRILNLGMDTPTPTGKLMLTVLGAIAQLERK